MAATRSGTLVKTLRRSRAVVMSSKKRSTVPGRSTALVDLDVQPSGGEELRSQLVPVAPGAAAEVAEIEVRGLGERAGAAGLRRLDRGL